MDSIARRDMRLLGCAVRINALWIGEETAYERVVMGLRSAWRIGRQDEVFYLLIGGLAAYRLSLMISKEDGPAYIFRNSGSCLPKSLQQRLDLLVNGACPFGREPWWLGTYGYWSD